MTHRKHEGARAPPLSRTDARRPGEIVTRVEICGSVSSVPVRSEESIPTESGTVRTVRSDCEIVCTCVCARTWEGSVSPHGVVVEGGRRGPALAVSERPIPRRAFIPSRPPPSLPPRDSSSGRPGAAAGCSSGLTAERGALRGREVDREERRGSEGTWGRTRSCSRP